MSRKTVIENKNQGSLDFIENSLNENSKDLKKLVEQMKVLSEQINRLRESSSSSRIQNILPILQEKIDNIEKIICEKNQSSCKNEVSLQITPNSIQVTETNRTPFIIRCRTWDDFQMIASGAERCSIITRESEEIFEADALKGNQIIVYVGQLPELRQLLKVWLTHSLNMPENTVFEGSLTSK